MMDPIIINGDCIAIMAALPEASIDAIVTDPPYGLGFMGKGWDALPPGREWAEECLRVLKPGGHLLAFGGTRTWHRLAVAVEDAGFELRDSIAWMYGSGFPKSHDVGKAIDKHLGVVREDVYASNEGVTDNTAYGKGLGVNLIERRPGSPEAERWQGWGTALKPAFEPIVVGRKPLIGTVAANVLEYDTGGINVDGCRINMNGEVVHATRNTALGVMNDDGWKPTPGTFKSHDAGRWPANVVLDESMAAELDAQSGTLKSGLFKPEHADNGKFRDAYGDFKGQEECVAHRGADSGGASRFFYVAREDQSCPNLDPASTAAPTSCPPSGSDGSAPSGAATSALLDTAGPTDSPSTNATPTASRPSGETSTPATPTTAAESSPESPLARPTPTLSPARAAGGGLPTDTTTTTTGPSTSDGSAGPATSGTTPNSVPGVLLDDLDAQFKYVAKAGKKERPVVDGVAHPTVKPIALMRWLCRLVTPPGGRILEPFAGSGTTVEAAMLEGFDIVAIERETEYLPLIQSRIDRAKAELGEVVA